MRFVLRLRRRWPFIAVPLVAVLTAGAVVYAVSDPDCTDCLRPAGGGSITTALKVTGETGEPLADATVTLHAPLDKPVKLTTGDDGVAEAPDLMGPAVAVVEADGHLPEPVPLGWSDSGKQVEIKMIARKANRFAVHSAGDVMFGRRYAAPTQEESSGRAEPLIPDGDAAAGAENVVAAIAPAFAAADFRTVNVETVLSDKPADAAYPGKRYILKSAAQTAAGLRKLSTDLAVLANNHSRDLLDAGVADTRAALSRAGIAMVGAGANAEEAAAAHHRDGMSVLAYTSVEGSFVNESFPAAGVRQPADVSPKDQWQYQTRSWGFPAAGIPVQQRRIREAWERFSAAESKSAPEQVAAMWASLSEVYPEMQDWVARRGHGGAAVWDDKTSVDQIRAAAEKSPLVMVQMHAGFQFQEAASDNIREIARKAVDAGADIVVAHHPHVLQGMEWYKGKLIAYSLGNFVFEQNFLASFASAFLRTVWEGDQLVEARLYPLELVDYKPVPVTDSAARRVLGSIWERSLLPLESYRADSGDIRTKPKNNDKSSTSVSMVLERHTARLTAATAQDSPHNQEIKPRELADLPVPAGALVKPGEARGLEVGRDLYGWGHFEDETADAQVSEAVHWSVNSKREGVRSGTASHGLRSLHLEAKDGNAVQTRPIARIPLPRHRAYEEKRGKPAPADPVPSYSFTANVRRSTSAVPELRVDVYHFDDSNPAEDPSSEVVATYTKPVDVPADGKWHRVVIDIPVSELDSGPGQGNMIMPYLKLGAPASSSQTAWAEVDELRFFEWREATDATVKAFGSYGWVRNRTDVSLTLPYAVREQ
ncbi:CapA family protein [Lentzea sp. BCCO 10_0856]|uniref:CapA family protein n=1 Tax=Lentzea miocenica TaxID=3095431 RepID=A0ABU4TG91_9PSEU|nr:CapA family protein [Lentzea sp. BCCO 10_0856]MDX8037205.1 CapA family protein [Lentzea sp. BCCO 10_0856]